MDLKQEKEHPAECSSPLSFSALKMITITILVGLVLSTWENRYLLENLEGCMEATAASLAGVAEADTPTGVALRPLAVPYKLSHRLGSEQRAAIVRYYCEGHSSRETARRFDVGKTAVLDILREEGVQPRPPHRKCLDPIR